MTGLNCSDFSQKKCNSGKNWQFKPKRHLRIDLDKAASLLEGKGALIEIGTSSLLIFRLNGLQIDLNSSGKTIAKTGNRERAEKAFESILSGISKAGKSFK